MHIILIFDNNSSQVKFVIVVQSVKENRLFNIHILLQKFMRNTYLKFSFKLCTWCVRIESFRNRRLNKICLLQALSRLGLIAWIGKQTERIILSVNEESRLAVAILLLLWVSAFASAFVDNVPLSTMMIRIVTALAQNNELKLPLQPLVWALAFGACMGGKRTWEIFFQSQSLSIVTRKII